MWPAHLDTDRSGDGKEVEDEDQEEDTEDEDDEDEEYYSESGEDDDSEEEEEGDGKGENEGLVDEVEVRGTHALEAEDVTEAHSAGAQFRRGVGLSSAATEWVSLFVESLFEPHSGTSDVGDKQDEVAYQAHSASQTDPPSTTVRTSGDYNLHTVPPLSKDPSTCPIHAEQASAASPPATEMITHIPKLDMFYQYALHRSRHLTCGTNHPGSRSQSSSKLNQFQSSGGPPGGSHSSCSDSRSRATPPAYYGHELPSSTSNSCGLLAVRLPQSSQHPALDPYQWECIMPHRAIARASQSPAGLYSFF